MTRSHGGPNMSEENARRAEETALRLGREVKRTLGCVDYPEHRHWFVFHPDGEVELLHETPPPVDEDEWRDCYNSRCSLEDQHKGAHDQLRQQKERESYRVVHEKPETSASMREKFGS